MGTDKLFEPDVPPCDLNALLSERQRRHMLVLAALVDQGKEWAAVKYVSAKLARFLEDVEGEVGETFVVDRGVAEDLVRRYARYLTEEQRCKLAGRILDFIYDSPWGIVPKQWERLAERLLEKDCSEVDGAHIQV